MVIVDFQMEDKGGRHRFFQETFLVADTKFKVILGMPFLKISNTDVAFVEGIFMLTWKSYTINKALPTIEQVQLVDPNKFVIAVLNADSETFVVYVVIQERKEMIVDLGREAQIEAQVRAVLFDKAFTKVSAECSDYSDVFSVENAAELSENTGINKHVIDLEEGK